MYFSNDRRPKIKANNPELSFGDLARQVGKEYKLLTAEEKVVYDEKAATDKVRYQKQMANYTPPSDDGDSDSGSDTKPKGKKKRPKKDPNAPKRGLTAFMYFSNDRRPKIKANNPELSFGDLARQVGKEYKLLTAEEKVVYDGQAAKDKMRYKDQMAIYNNKAAAIKAKVEDSDDDSDDASDSD